mgnify:CR=1 FL=1
MRGRDCPTGHARNLYAQISLPKIKDKKTCTNIKFIESNNKWVTISEYSWIEEFNPLIFFFKWVQSKGPKGLFSDRKSVSYNFGIENDWFDDDVEYLKLLSLQHQWQENLFCLIWTWIWERKLLREFDRISPKVRDLSILREDLYL